MEVVELKPTNILVNVCPSDLQTTEIFLPQRLSEILTQETLQVTTTNKTLTQIFVTSNKDVLHTTN